MSLKSLLLDIESTGEIDFNIQASKSTLTASEKRKDDSTPIKVKNDDNGEKRYCFRTVEPVKYGRDISEYPFRMEGEVIMQDGISKPVFHANIQADQQYTVPFSNTDVLSSASSLRKRLMVTIKKMDSSAQDVVCRYESDGGYVFQSTATAYETSIILHQTNKNKILVRNDASGQFFPGLETIFYIFQEGVDNKRLIFSSNVEVSVFIIDNDDPTVTKTYGTVNLGLFGVNSKITRTSTYINMPLDIYKGTRGNKKNVNRKDVIEESKEGFWKIVTENYKIKIKISLEGYGVMGGTFGNWLTDSGFKTVEENYQYERDGEIVTATTVTIPKPTRKCGIWQPYFGQLQYSGEMMCLSHKNLVEVYYTEREWALANSIYAKNFATDLKRELVFTTTSDKLLVTTNVLPHAIPNTPGLATIRYKSGGFGQIDTSTYTGIALVFRFECTNEDIPANSLLTPEQQRTIAMIGGSPCVGYDGCRLSSLAKSGYGSCYQKVSQEIDLSVTYTSLLPSDPNFTTGGNNFTQTVTLQLQDSFLSLQQQINDITTRMNIADLTSGIMSFVSLGFSFPQILEGVKSVFQTALKTFNKIKGKVKGIGSRVKGIRYVRLFDDDIIVPSTPTLASSVRINRRPAIASNMLSDDELFTALHGFASRLVDDQLNYITPTSIAIRPRPKTNIQPVEYMNPIIASRVVNSTPPAILPDDAFTVFAKERLGKIISRDIPSPSLIEVNQISNTISVLDSAKKLATYSVDPDIIDAVLGTMAGTHTRSLFSLKVRKQLVDMFDQHGGVKLTYGDLIKKMLNDKELVDITNHLTPDLTKELFQEFKDLINNALC